MQLQVCAVQKICREDAGRCLRGQWGQTGPAVTFVNTAFSPSPQSADRVPTSSASNHGDVQPVHAVQGGVAKVQPRRMGGEAQVGCVHRGGRVVQDAGCAQHLAVEVIDEGEPNIRLHAQKTGAGGALQEVLQASTSCAALCH